MNDDCELSRRAISGDRQAAGEIYDRYAPLVRAIVLDATGSLGDANELVQEVFLRALGNLGQLRDSRKLAAWIVGIARREGADYRRRLARERRHFQPLLEEPAEIAGGEGASQTRYVPPSPTYPNANVLPCIFTISWASRPKWLARL